MSKLPKDLLVEDVLFTIEVNTTIAGKYREYTTAQTVVDEVKASGKSREFRLINGKFELPAGGKPIRLPKTREDFNEDIIFTDEQEALEHIQRLTELENEEVTKDLEELTKASKRVKSLTDLYKNKKYLIDPIGGRDVTIEVTKSC